MTGKLLIVILLIGAAAEFIIFRQLGHLPRPEWPLEMKQ